MPVSQAVSNKTIVRELMDEIINHHQPAAWDRYASSDFVHYATLPNIEAGLAGIKQWSQLVIRAFPDVRGSTQLLLQEADWVVVSVAVTGTHLGNFRGIPSTTRRIQWNEIHVFKLADGKIQQYFPQVNIGQMMGQLSDRYRVYQPAQSVINTLMGAFISEMHRLLPAIKNEKEGQAARIKEVIYRYVEDFKNQQKFLVFPKLFQPKKFRHHFNFPGCDGTLATFISVGQEFLYAFRDVKVDLIQLIAEGDYVVEVNQVQATHRRQYFGIASMGRHVTWQEIHIYRLENERIVENWPGVDFEHIIHQISL